MNPAEVDLRQCSMGDLAALLSGISIECRSRDLPLYIEQSVRNAAVELDYYLRQQRPRRKPVG